MSDNILSREDLKQQLAVVADIGGQFTAKESWVAYQVIEGHDEALRADRDKWKDDHALQLERWQGAVARQEAAEKQLDETQSQLATALRERDEAQSNLAQSRDPVLAELREKLAAETKRLDYVLENRCIVIDGCVYVRCSWTTGLQKSDITDTGGSLSLRRRKTIDAAMGEKGQ